MNWSSLQHVWDAHVNAVMTTGGFPMPPVGHRGYSPSILNYYNIYLPAGVQTHVQPGTLVEPFLGFTEDVVPKYVILNHNPGAVVPTYTNKGITYVDPQACTSSSLFGGDILAARGYSAWAAPFPYLSGQYPGHAGTRWWQQKWLPRLQAFNGGLLQVQDIAAMELWPWHSQLFGPIALTHVTFGILVDFVFEPLVDRCAERGTHIIAHGAKWRDLLVAMATSRPTTCAFPSGGKVSFRVLDETEQWAQHLGYPRNSTAGIQYLVSNDGSAFKMMIFKINVNGVQVSGSLRVGVLVSANKALPTIGSPPFRAMELLMKAGAF